MFPDLHPDWAVLAFENVRWAGEDDRIYGAELVQYDSDGNELDREYKDYTKPYYPAMADLQDIISQANRMRAEGG